MTIQSVEQFKALIENSLDIITVLDGDGVLTYVSPSVKRVLGYEPDILVGVSALQWIHPDDLESVRQTLTDVLESPDQVHSVEFRFRHSIGDWRTLEAVGRKLPNPIAGGTIVVNARDVTEHRRTVSELRLLATAIEQSEETVLITDAEGIILYVNPAFERISGYSREEAIGRHTRMLKSGEHDPSFYQELWRTIASRKVWRGRLINRRKNGRLYHENATISPVVDSTNRIINYVAVKRDISRELELEQQFLRAQKMEAVGALAGGIAHDFRNIITGIAGFAQLAEQQVEPGSETAQDLEQVRRLTEKATSLTSQLLTFGREQSVQPRVFDIRDLFSDLSEMLRRTIREDIHLDISFCSELARIKADPGQIEQAIINLVVNARDAMPNGGTLTIRVENAVIDEALREELQAISLDPNRDYIRLLITDTGHGMDETVRNRIFEPFFTTKQGEGTGLGLFSVYGIVCRHEGLIRVNSAPEEGSTFEILLPVANEAAG